jgi:hypothetical protein
MGDFNVETSDVDFLAVVRDPISDLQFEALLTMHRRMAASGLRYADHLEGIYIDRESVRQFPGDRRRHPELLAEHDLQWANLRDNWVLERWVVRERGVALTGPPARVLIDPIAPGDLRTAAASELARRVGDWASETAVTPPWLRGRFMQAFEVETVCRALYTVRFGDLCSKPAAMRWAQGALPAACSDLLEWSQVHRADHTEDVTEVARVKAFARWAAIDGVTWAAGR